MTAKTSLFIAAAAAMTLTGLAAGPSAAAIQCNGNYQVVKGQLLSTPYCRDTNLARVANEYGMRVSANAVRWNPSVKERVCRVVGHDNRVFEACIGYRPDSGRRFWLP